MNFHLQLRTATSEHQQISDPLTSFWVITFGSRPWFQAPLTGIWHAKYEVIKILCLNIGSYNFPTGTCEKKLWCSLTLWVNIIYWYYPQQKNKMPETMEMDWLWVSDVTWVKWECPNSQGRMSHSPQSSSERIHSTYNHRYR